jgi:hypothetical protein
VAGAILATRLLLNIQTPLCEGAFLLCHRFSGLINGALKTLCRPMWQPAHQANAGQKKHASRSAFKCKDL